MGGGGSSAADARPPLAPKPLVVLIVVIVNQYSIVQEGDNSTAALTYKGDPRFPVMRGVTEVLRARGHTVLLAPATKVSYTVDVQRLNDKTYHQYKLKASPEPELVITWWAYKWQKKINLKKRPPVLQYENGLTHGDLIVDPGGLLGDSAYVARLNRLVQQDDDDGASCDAFVRERLASGAWSKRPQVADIDDVPASIRGRYVLVPTQHVIDLSITRFSNISMLALLREVAGFCRARRLPMVVKVHPHVDDAEKADQRKYVDQALRKRIGTDVYESVASIGYLTSNALFTVTLNGGTIMDNFYTQTPILTVARSMFSQTDAVVYDPDPARGLARMLDDGLAAHWTAERQRRQRQVACWVARMSMNINKTAQENVDVLQRHLDLAVGHGFVV